MKIAVIGSGIAGISAAWLLTHHAPECVVTVFEKNPRLGGHTHTVDVSLDGLKHRVDTGFLVFNERTYPNLIALFRQLGVATAASEMSFSVKLTDDQNVSRLEWSGASLTTMFSQPANVFRPRFWRMLRDIVRFNREATALAASAALMSDTVGDFLRARGYSAAFRDWYLAPMAGSIWSTPTQKIDDFPLATLLTFCHNHGLLSVNNRPPWRTVFGGARTYVDNMAAGIPDIRLNAAVTAVAREAGGVIVSTASTREKFDHIIFACHSDEALALHSNPSEYERAILTAIPYQPNTAILHTDASLLPERKRAWAAWNYHGRFDGNADQRVSLSYWLNRLQPLPFSTPVIVTMNPVNAPDPAKVIQTIAYQHPIFLPQSVAAKKQLRQLQGHARTWYAGAWTRYGFHEDGLMAGISVAKALGARVPWETNVPAADAISEPYPGVDA